MQYEGKYNSKKSDNNKRPMKQRKEERQQNLMLPINISAGYFENYDGLVDKQVVIAGAGLFGISKFSNISPLRIRKKLKNLTYPNLTTVFRLHNICLEFSNCKLKWFLCTETQF